MMCRPDVKGKPKRAMAIMPLKRVVRVRRAIPKYRPAPLFRGVLVHIPILIARKIVQAASIAPVMRHGLGMPWDMKRKWCAPAIVIRAKQRRRTGVPPDITAAVIMAHRDVRVARKMATVMPVRRR